MIVLGVAVDRASLGGSAGEPYFERLVELGVRAIEAQLSPSMASDDIARWGATIKMAAAHGLAVNLHAPLPPGDPAWPRVLAWAQASARPGAVVVHGCSGPRPDARLAEWTVAHLRSLADAAPDVLVALENGANIDAGPLARLRAAVGGRRRRAAARSRPSGVGSGMGAVLPSPAPRSNDPVDAPPRPRPRAARWNAAASRAAAVEIVRSVDRSNCMLAWDLAHDWLAGSALDAWTAVPDRATLDRVGYVRVHDVDDSGVDHCLLVTGNVPYATQLRALLRAGFDRTVCLAARYTAAMRPYGDRWRTLERSLRVLQQTLRLS